MGKPKEIREIPSWLEFQKAIEDLFQEREAVEAANHGRHFEVMFRGVGDSHWGLETTLERSFPGERSSDSKRLSDYYREIFSSRPALATFTNRQWPDLPIPPNFDEALKNSDAWTNGLPTDAEAPGLYEYLIYLRHHGYPSPLLDWTQSPYVAAFFAYDSIGRGATHVAVYALLKDSMRGSSSGQPNVSILGPYVKSHPRHFNQQSRYSICIEVVDGDYLFAPHEPAIVKDGAGIEGKLIKLQLPAVERSEALRTLELMNINPYSVYGSEESLVRTIARRECLLRRR